MREQVGGGGRFNAETLTKINRTPHDEHAVAEAPPVFQDLPPQEPADVRPGRAARGSDIYNMDVEKIGFTSEGCPKCARASAWLECSEAVHPFSRGPPQVQQALRGIRS